MQQPHFVHVAGKAWSSAHRLISSPHALATAQAEARLLTGEPAPQGKDARTAD